MDGGNGLNAAEAIMEEGENEEDAQRASEIVVEEERVNQEDDHHVAENPVAENLQAVVIENNAGILAAEAESMVEYPCNQNAPDAGIADRSTDQAAAPIRRTKSSRKHYNRRRRINEAG